MQHEAWVKPGGNEIKINVDGAIDYIRMEAVMGILARNEHGLSLGCRNVRISFSSPLVVELFAIKEGLSYAVERGWCECTVESDLELAVNIGNGRKLWFGNCNSLVHQIQQLLQNDSVRFSLSHVPRVANHGAHWLARNGLAQPTSKHDFCVIPSVLQSILYFDKLGLSVSSNLFFQCNHSFPLRLSIIPNGGTTFFSLKNKKRCINDT